MLTLDRFDARLIGLTRRISMPLARFSIFLVYFWFGILKVIGLSPATGLVKELLERTIPFMSPDTFILLFGLFEMLIGLLFLIRGLERVVIPLLITHLFTTLMPLLLLPSETWARPLVPTFEGQYIIKNIVIVATAIAIASHLHPLKNGAPATER